MKLPLRKKGHLPTENSHLAIKGANGEETLRKQIRQEQLATPVITGSGIRICLIFVTAETSNVLDHLDTAHFFLSQEGMTRFAGSTSGLPIL